MPSCAPASMSEMFSIAPQRGLRAARALLGARLDCAAPRGDERELRADEERVEHEQQHADGEGEESLIVVVVVVVLGRTDLHPQAVDAQGSIPRTSRRICLRAPSSSRASNSTASPTRGTRPSRSVTRPASVS